MLIYLDPSMSLHLSTRYSSGNPRIRLASVLCKISEVPPYNRVAACAQVAVTGLTPDQVDNF